MNSTRESFWADQLSSKTNCQKSLPFPKTELHSNKKALAASLILSVTSLYTMTKLFILPTKMNLRNLSVIRLLTSINNSLTIKIVHPRCQWRKRTFSTLFLRYALLTTMKVSAAKEFSCRQSMTLRARAIWFCAVRFKWSNHKEKSSSGCH